MSGYRVLPLLLLLVLGLASADPVRERQFDAIKRLGNLNGVALHCRALRETRKMKQALVRTLPQRRQLGELFDRQSHESYLAFIERRDRCPSLTELAGQVDDAIVELEQAYAENR